MASTYITHRAKQLRQRAEEIRKASDATQSAESRQILFSVAEDYERLARALEKLETPVGERENPAS